MGLALPDWRLVHPWALHSGRPPSTRIRDHSRAACAWIFSTGLDITGQHDVDLGTVKFLGGGRDFRAGGRTSERIVSGPTDLMPLAANADWTYTIHFRPRSYIVRTNIAGFGQTNLDSNPFTGGGRFLIQFNNNYYFWGSGRDWDTGIPFDTDNKPHIVTLKKSGSTLYFFRDGSLRATASAPSLVNITTCYLVAGAGINTALSSTDLVLYSVFYYAIALPDADIKLSHKNIYAASLTAS